MNIQTSPSEARRALRGDPMSGLAQEFGQELVEAHRKLSQAERRIGELERELAQLRRTQ